MVDNKKLMLSALGIVSSVANCQNKEFFDNNYYPDHNTIKYESRILEQLDLESVQTLLSPQEEEEGAFLEDEWGLGWGKKFGKIKSD